MNKKKKFHQQTEIFLRRDEGDFAKRLEENLDEIILFEGKYRKYCVELVDMVNSTNITANLTRLQISKFYGIFLNSIAMIAKKYGCKVVKNIGDSLLFYFPEFENPSFENYERPIECAFTILKYASIINNKMQRENLPPVSYRISADYGDVILAKSSTSSCEDIFGPTVNLCSKINRYARQNELVIGSDLRQIIKGLKNYQIEPVTGCTSGLKVAYPIYSVKMKNLRSFTFF